MGLRNLSFIYLFFLIFLNFFSVIYLLNESKLKYFQLEINMDKPEIVCCAVFSNQDQGIKISY